MVDVGIVRITVRHEDGWYGCQPDYYGPADGDPGGGAPLECVHPYGFISRPRDPDVDGAGAPTKGCTLLYGWLGSDGWSLPAQDPRDLALLPSLPAGSSMQYGANGTFALLNGETGSWELYVPYAKDGSGVPTKAHSVLVQTEAGNESVCVVHGTGAGFILNKDGAAVVKNAAGDAYIEVGAGGIVLGGLIKLVGGIVAGNPSTAQPVALHAALATMATALAAWTAAAGAILNAVPTPPTPAQQSALAAAQTALAAAAAAVTAPATGGSVTLKASPV